MRRLYVTIILGVFVAYCVAAHRSQGKYRLPRYELVELHILGGATPTQWASPGYASQRYDRLRSLEQRGLQPVQALAGLRGGNDVTPDQALTSEDFAALVARCAHTVPLRDPAPIRKLVARGLRLRQAVHKPGDPSCSLGAEGAPVTKELVDRCLDQGLTSIPVVGEGDVVGFNATVFMVVLIFAGMTLVLKDVFWEPVMSMLDARVAKVNQGRRLIRENIDRARLIEERRRHDLRRIRDDYRQRMSEVRTEAMKEVDVIMRGTRVQIRRLREEAAIALHRSLRDAGNALRCELPSLAQEVVRRVGGSGAPSAGRDEAHGQGREL